MTEQKEKKKQPPTYWTLFGNIFSLGDCIYFYGFKHCFCADNSQIYTSSTNISFVFQMHIILFQTNISIFGISTWCLMDSLELPG